MDPNSHWVCSEWTYRESCEFICTNPNNTNEIERVHIRSVVKVVIGIAELEERKQIHACILKKGFDLNIFVGNTLVYMYAKRKVFKDAWKVFEIMHEWNVVLWSGMVGDLLWMIFGWFYVQIDAEVNMNKSIHFLLWDKALLVIKMLNKANPKWSYLIPCV